MTRIAYLGTGLLGSAFAEAALGRGFQVSVWNRTRARAEALAAHGATVADTPADAVRGAERVHLVLKDDDSVDEVLAQLRPGLAPDALILDHTTLQPARTGERARRLAADGVHYLHCPVMIGPAMARQSKGTIFVSGARELVARARPALERMAEQVEDFGDDPARAAVFKLCGNAMFIGQSALVADVFAIATTAGVEPTEATRIFDLLDPAAAMRARARQLATGEWPVSFELAMARKDVRLMLETAGDAPIAALEGIAARMDALIEAGEGGEDLAVIGKASVRSS